MSEKDSPFRFVEWQTFEKRVADKIEAMISGDHESTIFGADYIDRLSNKIIILEGYSVKVGFFNLAILVILFVSQYSQNISVEISGVKVASLPFYREMLFFSYIILTCSSNYLLVYNRYLKTIMKMIAKKNYGSASNESFMHSLSYTLELPLSDIVPSYKHPYTVSVVTTWSISLILFILAIVAASIFLQISIIFDMISTHYADVYVKFVIVTLAAIGLLFQITTLFILCPLPGINFESIKKLSDLEVMDPSAYKKAAISYVAKADKKKNAFAAMYSAFAFILVYTCWVSILHGAAALTRANYLALGLGGCIYIVVLCNLLRRIIRKHTARVFVRKYPDKHPEQLTKFRKLSRQRTLLMFVLPPILSVLYLLAISHFQAIP